MRIKENDDANAANKWYDFAGSDAPKRTRTSRIGRAVSKGAKDVSSGVKRVAQGVVSSITSFRSAVRHTSPEQMPFEPDVLEKAEAETRTNLHSSTRGKILEATFNVESRAVAKEVVSRTDVLSTLQKGHAHRLKHLEKYIQSHPNDQAAKTVRDLTVANLREVTTAIGGGATWAASGSYRRLLASSSSVEEAHQKYIPACVNLRTQTVIEDGITTSNINRSGAISDYRNGATNLGELKELQQFLRKCSRKFDLSEHQWNLLGLEPQKGRTLLELRGKIDSIVAERQWVLENQALQDLAAHLSSRSDESLKHFLNSQGPINYSRVSMLDGIKPPVKDGDFVLNEANQMLDMKEIYAVLDGKEIVFDGQGPFMDPEGKIHMPFKANDNRGKVISKTLNVIYFNISAQGNIANTGHQAAINVAALHKLRPLVESTAEALLVDGRPDDAEALLQRYGKLTATLRDGVSDGFDTAELAAMLAVDVGALLSINCFSGKDRTGLLAATITFNRLKTSLYAQGIRGSKAQSILSQWGRDLMSDTSCACLVVKDNTGYSALKISVFGTKLLFRGNAFDRMRGTSKRVMGLGKALSTFVTSPGESGDEQLWAA
ncbi:MAG: hypothetical protein Q8K75_04540 [Chlamydiales bacterium]|nr:hypothetical protein [Chlamydiales bacterium]